MNRIFTTIESYLNESKKYYDYIKVECFKDLPFEYKKALIIYFYEGYVADWSINIDIKDILKDDKLVNILIDDYIKAGKRNKYKCFGYGEVPINVLTKEISNRLGYDTFQEYHEWYNDYTDHGDSIIPIILNLENDELIEDGWHRFHSYYRKGFKKIPVVVFNATT